MNSTLRWTAVLSPHKGENPVGVALRPAGSGRLRASTAVCEVRVMHTASSSPARPHQGSIQLKNRINSLRKEGAGITKTTWALVKDPDSGDWIRPSASGLLLLHSSRGPGFSSQHHVRGFATANQ